MMAELLRPLICPEESSQIDCGKATTWPQDVSSLLSRCIRHVTEPAGHMYPAELLREAPALEQQLHWTLPGFRTGKLQRTTARLPRSTASQRAMPQSLLLAKRCLQGTAATSSMACFRLE